MNDWQFYLFLTLLFVVIEAFFAMVEMACISFNKVRLQYYVSKNNRRARWLSYLLSHPVTFFGTSLICINAALQFGSESSRRFYALLHLNPDWAPLSQVLIVLIFGELAPLFAARRHAEQVAMAGIPILYFFSKILTPIIWLLDLLCRGINRLLHIPGKAGLYLTREEIQKAVEAKEVKKSSLERDDLGGIITNIFNLKTKGAKDLMQPLSTTQLVPSTCTVDEMRTLLKERYVPYLPIYHRDKTNVIAIAYPRDLLRLPGNKRIREYAKPPWFITEEGPILQILKQFRRNNKSIAVVLDQAGRASGILTLDEIVDEIFEQTDRWVAFGEMMPKMHPVVIDRTFPGDMKIADFNQQFSVRLDPHGVETLSELVILLLGHHPAVGETVRIDQFELTVEEAALFEAKSIAIRTIF